MGRSISSFVVRLVEWILEFDGSLTGCGYRIFKFVNGIEAYVAAGAVLGRDDFKGDSSYQNAMELTAFICALAALVKFGVRGVSVIARGDSISCLTWISGEKTDFVSARARGGTMVFVSICEALDITVSLPYQHISSEENHVCDALSRGVTPSAGSCPGAVAASGSGLLRQICDLCSPLAIPQSEEAFAARWIDIRRVLSEAPATPW
jgi:ribonuclease HI